MAQKRITDEILRELAKKYPNKTREELLILRRKILKKVKVADIIKKQQEQIKDKKEDPFSPENIKRTKETTSKVMKRMEESTEQKFLILINPKKKDVIKNFRKNGIRYVAVQETKEIFVANAKELYHLAMARRFIPIMKKMKAPEAIDELNKSKKYKTGILTLIKDKYWHPFIPKEWEWIKKYLPIGKVNLNESLQYVKFAYDNNDNKDKHPKVKVLDFKYKGQQGQKTYGKRQDLLGWNLRYFSNKRYAEKAIDDIDSFSRMLGANSREEKYKRIKYFFPQQAKLIRRYIRKHIKNLKHKPGVFFWKGTNFDELIKFDKQSY